MAQSHEDYEWQLLQERIQRQQPDQVNAPAHYNQGGIECIEAIKASMTHAEFHGYLKGNAMKYLWRYDNKGKPEQDLAKCGWYLDRLRDEVATQYKIYEQFTKGNTK